MLKTLSDYKKYSEENLSLTDNFFWLNVKQQFNPSLAALNELDWVMAVEKMPFNTSNLNTNTRLTMSDAFIKTLINRFTDYFTSDEKGSYLHDYCKKNNCVVAQYLLDKGSNANFKKGINLETPLHSVRSIDIARLLLKYNADPNIKNIKGNTCLYNQVRFFIWNVQNNTEIISLLLKGGADPDIKNNDKHETVLHYIMKLKTSTLCLSKKKISLSAAIIEQRRGIIARLLLENRANPNIVDKRKHSVLYYTANKDFVHLLLSWGAK